MLPAATLSLLSLSPSLPPPPLPFNLFAFLRRPSPPVLLIPVTAACSRGIQIRCGAQLGGRGGEICDGLAVREPRAAAARSLAVLRFHLYNTDDRAPLRVVLALKRHPCIEANISRIEEPVDPALALACANNPARLGGVSSPIVHLVAGEVGVGQDTAPFVWLGEFRQTRAIYELEDGGLVLELDEMQFDFGTSYELECDGLA